MVGTSAKVRQGPSFSIRAFDFSLRRSTGIGTRPYPPRMRQNMGFLIFLVWRGLAPYFGHVEATLHFWHVIWSELTGIHHSTLRLLVDSRFEMTRDAHPYDSLVMRELGQSMTERGFFEVNLSTTSIEWLNDFALAKFGMTLEQIQSMTMYDLVPVEHHEMMGDSIADESRGRAQKFSIWPHKTSDGKLVWWYVTKAKSAHPYHWYKAEYLNTTEKSGPEYASMLAAMMTANSYNDLHTKLLDHQDWTRGEVNRLSEETRELREGQAEIRDQVKGCRAAADKAANEALEANAGIKSLRGDMDTQFSKQTTEILRLISTDTQHEARMAAFATSMNKVAEEAAQKAVVLITESANKAGHAIVVQAKQAGQGLSRRVTIPVSAIAAVATIVQWVIAHWPTHH